MRSGKHVFDKALVPGHIHETDADLAQVEIGEAKIDCDAASFFFRESIRISASQSAHEGAFAVVDVASRSDDHGSGGIDDGIHKCPKSKVQCPMSAAARERATDLEGRRPRKAEAGPWTLDFGQLFDYLKINPLRRRAMFFIRQRIVSDHLQHILARLHLGAELHRAASHQAF